MSSADLPLFPRPSLFISKAEVHELTSQARSTLDAASPLTLPTAVAAVLEATLAKLQVPTGALLVLDPTRRTVETVIAVGPGQPPWADLAVASAPWLTQVLGDPDGSLGPVAALPDGVERTALAACGLAAVAAVPLLDQGRGIGVLLAASPEPVEWPYNARWLLQLTAAALVRTVVRPQPHLDETAALLGAVGELPAAMLAVYDAETHEGVYLGAALAELTGLTEEDWRTSTLHLLSHILPDDYQTLDRAARALATRGATYTLAREYAPPVELTVHLRDRSGAVRVCEVQFRILAGTARPLVAFLGQLQPEGTEALSEADVYHETSVLPAFVENANIIVALIDPRIDPRGLYVSAAYERWSGRSRESFLAGDAGIYAGLHPDDADEVDTRPLLIELLDGVAAGTVSSTEAFYRQEIRAFNEEFGERIVMLELFPVLHRGTWVAGVLGTDVTEERRLEAERDAALTAATEALATRDRFLARLSHELVSPMNGVLGHIALVRRSGLDPEQDLRLQRAQHASTRLIELIGDVLELGKIRADEPPVLNPVRLDDALEEVAAMLSPVAVNAGVVLSIELSELGGDPWVAATAGRLFQVLSNLVSNAIKFSPRHGSVELVGWREPGPDGEAVVVEVRDHGPGIAPELRERLFQPFERLGADSRGVAGTGLGLVVARELAESMGGRIELDEAVTDGAAFQVWLQPSEPGIEPAEPAAEVPLPQAGRDQVDVLYIEDDPSSREVVSEVLALDGRFIIHWAETLGDGLRRAAERDWELVLTDLHLPDAFGVEVVAQLHALPGLAHTPIVVTSADRRIETVEATLEAGAVEFWPKPLDFATLPTALVRTLATARADRRTRIEVAP